MDENSVLDANSWSDNLACVATSAEAAVHNFSMWSDVLSGIFNMQIKPDSRAVVPARTRIAGDAIMRFNNQSWRVVDKENVLGCWLTGTGTDTPDTQAIRLA